MENQNERYEYEKAFLEEILYLIRLTDKELHRKVSLTGEINCALGEAFGISDIEFILAGYYANIGMLGISNTIRQKTHLTEKEMDVVKRHGHLSSLYMKHKQLPRAEALIKFHHEFPDGTGYHKEQVYPEDANLIHISDMFVGLITPRHDRLNTFYTGFEAWKIIEQKYSKTRFFEHFNKNKIEKVLEGFTEEQ